GDEAGDVGCHVALHGELIRRVRRVRRFLRRLTLGERVTGPSAPLIGDCAARDLVDPGAEALVLAEAWQAALDAEEYVLEHVIDIKKGHAPRNEGPEASLERPVGATQVRVDHAEPSGAIDPDP